MVALPKRKNEEPKAANVTPLFSVKPSESEDGNQFIDLVAQEIEKDYGVLQGSGEIAKIIRNRVKVTVDELVKTGKINIKPENKENINKIKSALRAELTHLLMPE